MANEDDKQILASRDLGIENLNHTFYWLSKARDYAAGKGDAFIQTVEEAFAYLIKNRDADEAFAQALEESGMLTDWQEERDAHLYRYNAVSLCQMVSLQKTTFDREIEMLSLGFTKLSEMLKAIKSYQFVFPSSQFLRLYRELYEQMIRDVRMKASIQASLVATGKLYDTRPARIYENCAIALQ